MAENNNQASNLSQEELQRRLDENREQKPKLKSGTKKAIAKSEAAQASALTTNYVALFVKSSRNLCKNDNGSISVHQEMLLYAPGGEKEKTEKEFKLVHEKTEPLGPAKFTSEMTCRAFRGEKSLRIILDTVFKPHPPGNAFHVNDQLFLVDGDIEEFIANFVQIHLPKDKDGFPAKFDLNGSIGISIKQQLATKEEKGGYRIKDAIEIRTHNSAIMPTQQLPCLPSDQSKSATTVTEKVYAGKDVMRIDRKILFDINEITQSMVDHAEYVPVGTIEKEKSSSTRTGRSISSDLPPTARSEFTTNTAISPYQSDRSSSEREQRNVVNTARYRSPSSKRSPSSVRKSRLSSKKWTVNSKKKRKEAKKLRTAVSSSSDSAPVTQHSPHTLANLLQEHSGRPTRNDSTYSLHMSDSDSQISQTSSDQSEELSLANGWFRQCEKKSPAETTVTSKAANVSRSSSIRGSATSPFSKSNTESDHDLKSDRKIEGLIPKTTPGDTMKEKASSKLARTPISSTLRTARSPRLSMSPTLRRTLIKEASEISSFPPPHHFVESNKEKSNRPKIKNRSKSRSFEIVKLSDEADPGSGFKILSAESIKSQASQHTTDNKECPMENSSKKLVTPQLVQAIPRNPRSHSKSSTERSNSRGAARRLFHPSELSTHEIRAEDAVPDDSPTKDVITARLIETPDRKRKTNSIFGDITPFAREWVPYIDQTPTKGVETAKEIPDSPGVTTARPPFDAPAPTVEFIRGFAAYLSRNPDDSPVPKPEFKSEYLQEYVNYQRAKNRPRSIPLAFPDEPNWPMRKPSMQNSPSPREVYVSTPAGNQTYQRPMMSPFSPISEHNGQSEDDSMPEEFLRQAYVFWNNRDAQNLQLFHQGQAPPAPRYVPPTPRQTPPTPGQHFVHHQHPLNLGSEYQRNNLEAMAMNSPTAYYMMQQQQRARELGTEIPRMNSQAVTMTNESDKVKVEFQMSIHTPMSSAKAADSALTPKRVLLNGQQIWHS